MIRVLITDAKVRKPLTAVHAPSSKPVADAADKKPLKMAPAGGAKSPTPRLAIGEPAKKSMVPARAMGAPKEVFGLPHEPSKRANDPRRLAADRGGLLRSSAASGASSGASSGGLRFKHGQTNVSRLLAFVAPRYRNFVPPYHWDLTKIYDHTPVMTTHAVVIGQHLDDVTVTPPTGQPITERIEGAENLITAAIMAALHE